MHEMVTDAASPPETTLILRVWREGEGVESVWRCSVEDPSSRQRRGFATLAELLPFLQVLTDSEDLRHAADAGAAQGGLPEPRDETL